MGLKNGFIAGRHPQIKKSENSTNAKRSPKIKF